MPTDPVLLQTILEVGRALPQTTNIGRSGNQQDLYFLLDYLTFAVHRAYPAILCRAGCSMCCRTYGIPRTTQAEWDLIREHLETAMDPDLRGRIQERAETGYRSVMPFFQEESLSFTSLYTGGRPSAAIKQRLSCHACPFLENDLCTIYPVRPAICRGYGYFTIRLGGEQPTLFTCQMAADDMMARMRAAGEEHWMLPAWNKFADRVVELNSPGAPIKFLPEWLLEWSGERSNPIPENTAGVSPTSQALPIQPGPFPV